MRTARRRPIKPQKLLDYEKGSLTNLLYANLYNDEGAVGFERCIAARRKDLKWIGRTGKVYRWGSVANSSVDSR